MTLTRTCSIADNFNCLVKYAFPEVVNLTFEKLVKYPELSVISKKYYYLFYGVVEWASQP